MNFKCIEYMELTLKLFHIISGKILVEEFLFSKKLLRC